MPTFGPLSPWKKGTDKLAWVQWRDHQDLQLHFPASVSNEGRLRELERGWFRRNLTAVHDYLMGWCGGVESVSSQRHKRPWTHGRLQFDKEKHFQYKGWQLLSSAVGVQRGCRASTPGNTQNVTGHRPEHYGLVGFEQQAGHGGLQRTFSSMHFCRKVYAVPMS